jgi:aldose 1-epimerase
LVLDHGFAGWRNRAVIRWPARGCCLEIAAERPLDLAVVYAPEGADYFCLEPVSNIDDGFNALALGLRGHGVKILEPSETLSASVTFRPRFHRERVDAN